MDLRAMEGRIGWIKVTYQGTFFKDNELYIPSQH